jgi:hypothetical protein
MTNTNKHMTYAKKLKPLINATTADAANAKSARKEYRALVSPKTQCDFLNEVRVLAGNPPWNDLADDIGITRRAFINYRLPEHSGNYRGMNDATLRQVFSYLNAILNNDNTAEIRGESTEEISQKELFTIIKDLTGGPIWKDLSAALDINYVTLLNYILPDDSKNYRKLPPANFQELVALKNRLLSLTEEGHSEEELWDSIKNGAFEKPDMNIDLSGKIVRALKKQANSSK